jgi:tRNA1Val (adenine37-N6)-methyltransferase
MSSLSFRFRQFEIYHDCCAMKVGTDGVLLGAWIKSVDAKRILDVGTGSGLIAIILAQHSTAAIDGLECDKNAAKQAKENVIACPWSERVQIFEQDFKNYSNGFYDLIVSNPPYFRNSLKAPTKSRNMARHTDTLSHDTFIEKSAQMLNPDGRLAVILPFESENDFEDFCWQNKLYLNRYCEVSSIEGRPPKRILLEFSFHHSAIERTSISIYTKEHKLTKEFSILTSDLYLDK